MSSLQEPLSAPKRREQFENTKRTTEGHGLRAHVCGCMNPAISKDRCLLAGERHPRVEEATQMTLFGE
jgi:hypothetical protein